MVSSARIFYDLISINKAVLFLGSVSSKVFVFLGSVAVTNLDTASGSRQPHL